jgi:hypothetical protein
MDVCLSVAPPEPPSTPPPTKDPKDPPSADGSKGGGGKGKGEGQGKVPVPDEPAVEACLSEPELPPCLSKLELPCLSDPLSAQLGEQGSSGWAGSESKRGAVLQRLEEDGTLPVDILARLSESKRRS